jgi:hypothetical protein
MEIVDAGRFHDVTEDMTVLVFFAPACTGRP